MKNIKIFELFEDRKDSITCPQFESIVEQIELTEGKPSPEVKAHIQECSECSDYYTFWQEMERIIHWHTSDTGKEIISEWEQQKSIHRIQQSVRKEQQRRKILLWSALSVAVVILFLMLAIFYFIPATQAPSVQAIEQPSSVQSPPTDYSGSSIPYNTAPETKVPDKDI